MKRPSLFFFIAIGTLWVALILARLISTDHQHTAFDVDAMEEDLSERNEWMRNMLADPATGEIPAGIREKEVAFSMVLPAVRSFGKFGDAWKQRGPWNVGGRTRALVIDKMNENVLVAGSATGGIWRSTDAGASWVKSRMDSAEACNVTCLEQNRKPGKNNEWYAGTGELYGGSLPGAFYAGSGMYKSTDNGLTWKKLLTFNITPGFLSGNWAVIHNLAINNAVDSIDVIFVANFDGIFRSINGGATWQKRRGAVTAGQSYFTDVAVTASGIVYATLSGGNAQAGIWRSADNGNTWTNITPSWFNLTTCGRVVIGIAPSDEKQVYFAAHSPGAGKESFNFEGTSEWNSLWKYTYVSGDGSGTGGQWSDRSPNIPKIGGAFGDFISQQGYCLNVDVKPDNPDVVFLGGANLYRSTDGFTSSANTTWVGGYAVGAVFPNYGMYPNQHPDQHGMIFYPSDASKAISIHDGGISRTDNVLAPSITWTDLNKGYLTTQFYTIALDQTTTSDIIFAGAQDNGTWRTSSSDPYASWTQPLGGDGSFLFLAPGANEAYLSTQQGKIQRCIFDQNGSRVQIGRLDPAGVPKAKYQFINPFTPDANLFKRIYTPAGDRLWRNDDVTVIPLKTQVDSNRVLTNWTELTNTILTDPADEITAIISPKDQPDVIYYGTMKGKLYRLRNASVNSSVPENITGGNFPAAYINCIVRHPADTSKLFAVFTNYSVLSIFYSANSGASWTAVSGNLEQQLSGSGNGPSCRWLTIAQVQDSSIYFVGTSTGLYATKNLNAMQTVWVKQSADRIASNVVMMMDYRPLDGRIVVATYGAGIFSSTINGLDPASGVPEQNDETVKVFPNPVSDWLHVRVDHLPGTDRHYRLMDAKGSEIVHGTLDGEKVIDMRGLAPGPYYLRVGSFPVRKLMKK